MSTLQHHLRPDAERITSHALYPAVLLASATALIAFAAIVAFAWPFWHYLDFHPLNGAFQTFNPTRRLLAGKLPGGGFEPYLGVGVSFFHALLTWLLGGDFAASQFMARLIPPIVVLAYVAVIMRLAKFRFDIALLLFWFVSLLLVATMLRIGLVPYGLRLPDVFQELIEPGVSALTSRLALPLFVVGAIRAFERLAESAVARAGARAGVYGALAGLSPFWSNDYGIASFACLAAIYWLAIAPRQPAKAAAAMLWGTALVAGFGAGLFVAGGTEWLRYNFLGVAADQFWFFGFAGENPPPAFRITDVLAPGWVWVYGAACAWLLARAMGDARDGRRPLLAYVVATPFVAGLIATIGGHSNVRYFLPLRILMPFVLGAIAVDIVGQRSRASDHPGAAGGPKNDVFRVRRTGPRTLASVALLMVASAVLWWPQFLDAFRSHFNPRGDYFVEPMLGGRVQEFYSGLIGVGREIATATRDLPPEQRVISTYASALDVVAGARNAPGQDYIIHAFGDRERADFLATFHAAAPRYATAISDRFTTWGEWQWYANWWFFRDLILAYRPKYETSTHIAFELRDEKVEPKPVACNVTVESSHSAVITTRPLEGQPAPPLLVEISLTYSVRRSAAEPAGLLAAFRSFVDVAQLGSAEIPPRNVGAPPGAVEWPILAKDFTGKGAAVRVTVTPPTAWDLVVSACKARVFGAAKDFQRGAYFVTTAANIADANWQRGVAVAPNPTTMAKEAGLILRDASDIASLAPGSAVRLASGVRRIARVDGNRLWLEGPPLDPVVDGFPALVKLPQTIAPASAVIRASGLTDANWTSGIWVGGGINPQWSFFFDTSTFPLGLAPGDELQFASAGRRSVLRVAQNGPYTNVLVSGGALSPTADGYPNPIRIGGQGGGRN